VRLLCGSLLGGLRYEVLILMYALELFISFSYLLLSVYEHPFLLVIIYLDPVLKIAPVT
jgi:hypothetical protein